MESQFSAMCLLALEEPTCFEEAVKEPNWRNAIEEEMKSIRENETWELVKHQKTESPQV